MMTMTDDEMNASQHSIEEVAALIAENRALRERVAVYSPDPFIYAGLDVDGKAKLFYVSADEKRNFLLRHEDWLKVLGGIGAQAGEMLRVYFVREHDAAFKGRGRDGQE